MSLKPSTSPAAGGDKLVLASASPRRRELLASLGYRFEVEVSQVDEAVLPEEQPAAHVVRLSEEKAREVAARVAGAGRWYLGSDTVVVCDGQILGKPADAAQARTMLAMLSGRSHEVYSGFALYDRHSEQMRSGAVVTEVEFRPLTKAEIAGYIASGEPFDKAGAYAIQGLAAAMVRRISGSYSNVVGLPLCEVVEALTAAGLPSPLTGDQDA
ncbi:MAG: septum formation inhibitor Maf [Desulfuromonas sp.]|nr:MAG: septum formation inhibitor Maf [Desulfuromonas sp.]